MTINLSKETIELLRKAIVGYQLVLAQYKPHSDETIKDLDYLLDMFREMLEAYR